MFETTKIILENMALREALALILNCVPQRLCEEGSLQYIRGIAEKALKQTEFSYREINGLYSNGALAKLVVENKKRGESLLQLSNWRVPDTEGTPKELMAVLLAQIMTIRKLAEKALLPPGRSYRGGRTKRKPSSRF